MRVHAHLVKIMEGDQFSSGFVDINPNSKIPALVDYSTDTPTHVFESGSILLYLANKFGHFIPASLQARTETLNWFILANGFSPVSGRWFWAFLQLCAHETRIPH